MFENNDEGKKRIYFQIRHKTWRATICFVSGVFAWELKIETNDLSQPL